MGVKTSEQIAHNDKKSLRFFRAVSGLTTIACISALGVFGTNGFTDNAGARATGTGITVAAPAVSLVCPQGFADGNSTQGNSGVGVDGIDDQPVTVAHNFAAALIGGEGSVSYGQLPVPRIGGDADNELNSGSVGAGVTTPPAPQTPGPGGVLVASEATNSSAAITRISEPTGALYATTADRAVWAPAEGVLTAASFLESQSGGDQRGIAAASCGAAASEHWLVGGSTSVGNSSMLVIQNPSLTPATVTITLWGPSGRVELAGSDTYIVPGGAQVSALLEAVAPEQRRMAVHVQAQGALVTAYLQQEQLDGITPGGIDYVTGSAGPSRVQTITGIQTSGVGVDSEDASFVRLVVPDFREPVNLAEQSIEDAASVDLEVIGSARMYLLGPDGNIVLFGAEEIELLAGSVQDVALGGVPAGVYSVIIEADVPLLAGAASILRGSETPDQPLLGTPRDIAWISSTPALANPEYTVAERFAEFNLGQDQFARELEPSSGSGAVAIPAGVRGTVSILGVPRVADVEELDALLRDIPLVYSALESESSGLDVPENQGDSTDEDLSEDASARLERWVPRISATVVGYGANGRVLGTRDVLLAPGQSTTIELSSLGNVAAVAVIEGEDSHVNWSVALNSPTLSGSASHLSPVTVGQEPTDMWVARTQQLQ